MRRDFLVLPQRFENFPSDLQQVGWHNEVWYGLVVDDSANGGWFLFYWGLILLFVMGVRFENTCIVSGK